MPYLLHYVIPILFPVYLFLCDRVQDIQRFYWLLGCSCWVFYFVWWLFPHAPPWVMLNLSPATPQAANAGVLRGIIEAVPLENLPSALLHKEGTAFHRLDSRSGFPFFFSLFVGSPVPFACFPSGHVAWAFSAFLIGGPGGKFFFLYVMWISWATMYSFHHYLMDALTSMFIVGVVHVWLDWSVKGLRPPRMLHVEMSAVAVISGAKRSLEHQTVSAPEIPEADESALLTSAAAARGCRTIKVKKAVYGLVRQYDLATPHSPQIQEMVVSHGNASVTNSNRSSTIRRGSWYQRSTSFGRSAATTSGGGSSDHLDDLYSEDTTPVVDERGVFASCPLFSDTTAAADLNNVLFASVIRTAEQDINMLGLPRREGQRLDGEDTNMTTADMMAGDARSFPPIMSQLPQLRVVVDGATEDHASELYSKS